MKKTLNFTLFNCFWASNTTINRDNENQVILLRWTFKRNCAPPMRGSSGTSCCSRPWNSLALGTRPCTPSAIQHGGSLPAHNSRPCPPWPPCHRRGTRSPQRGAWGPASWRKKKRGRAVQLAHPQCRQPARHQGSKQWRWRPLYRGVALEQPPRQQPPGHHRSWTWSRPSKPMHPGIAGGTAPPPPRWHRLECSRWRPSHCQRRSPGQSCQACRRWTRGGEPHWDASGWPLCSSSSAGHFVSHITRSQ